MSEAVEETVVRLFVGGSLDGKALKVPKDKYSCSAYIPESLPISNRPEWDTYDLHGYEMPVPKGRLHEKWHYGIMILRGFDSREFPNLLSSGRYSLEGVYFEVWNGRGGWRPGAGRPKSADRKTTKAIRVSAEVRQYLDDAGTGVVERHIRASEAFKKWAERKGKGEGKGDQANCN